MKITFVSPTPMDIYAPGVRILSSYIKKYGHEARIIFLPSGLQKLKFEKQHVYSYPDRIMDEIAEICKDSDLIGISCLTQYFDRAVHLTKGLKKRHPIPVIWGGIHASIKPMECIEFSDMVCVGEGEEAMLELLERMEAGRDYSDVHNIWLRKNGKVIQNEIKPLLQDLDSLPFYDYDLEDHYIYDVEKKGIKRMDVEILKKALPTGPSLDGKMKIAYRTMTDRGCPHKCNYCAVSTIKDMYKEQKFLRRRSVENAVEELAQIKKRFPFIQIVQFFDDTFFARPAKEIEEFCRLYKEKVGLQFHCQCSPSTIQEEKLENLIDAGLVFLEMGIQSGSEKSHKLYNRHETNQKILEATSIINKHKANLLSPCYHIILDNPWETSKDVKDTLNLILELSKPFWLKIASLTFYPETFLYHKAVKDGLLKDEFNDIYRKPFSITRGSYLNYLVYLAGHDTFPRWMLRVLSNDKIVSALNKESLRGVYSKLYVLTELVYKLSRGIKAILRGDSFRLFLYLRRFKNFVFSSGKTTADT